MEPMILNQNYELVDVLDVFSSLIWTDRYSDYGDFEISTVVSSEYVKKLAINQFLASEHSEHVMIIEDLNITTDVETGNQLVVSGRSLESILYRRIVWNQTILNGNFQNQLEKLFNENIINPSDQKRKINHFVFEKSTDPYITGLTVNAQFTGDYIYDAVKSLCDSFELGFKITLKEGNMVFKLYHGTDRSYEQEENPYVVFSPNFDNLINSDYSKSIREIKNIALVAGEGEGSSRKKTVVGNNSLSGLERKELFVDARDVSSDTEEGTISDSEYIAQLAKRGEEKLSECKTSEVFDGQVNSDRMYKYDEDFFMGDIVQFENEFGISSRVRITEYMYSESEDGGIEQYPTFKNLDDEE